MAKPKQLDTSGIESAVDSITSAITSKKEEKDTSKKDDKVEKFKQQKKNKSESDWYFGKYAKEGVNKLRTLIAKKTGANLTPEVTEKLESPVKVKNDALETESSPPIELIDKKIDPLKLDDTFDPSKYTNERVRELQSVIGTKVDYGDEGGGWGKGSKAALEKYKQNNQFTFGSFTNQNNQIVTQSVLEGKDNVKSKNTKSILAGY